MWAIFEKYSQSSFELKKKEYWPIETKMSMNIIEQMLLDYFTKKGYKNITKLEGFKELFGEKDGFEVTFHLIMQNPPTVRILVSVYGENQMGRTRKYMKEVLDELRPQFKLD